MDVLRRASPGRGIDVIIATRVGHEYLKTRADGEQPDNLLALPECPQLRESSCD